mgnify:FL=1
MQRLKKSAASTAVTLLLFAVVGLLIAGPAVAQEQYGIIDGTVTSGEGEALPGVTVEAKGPVGTVSAITNAQGDYRFPRLPSGVYTLTATLDGFTPVQGQVSLTVGTTKQLDFELRDTAVTETITVTSDRVLIDVTSASTATNLSRERIDIIPRGRDFTDVVCQAAGAQDESQAGGISIDGSSGAENRFIIDGIDTTSPQEGISSVPLRADFIEEVQVKSAGYAAEFGGSTGGVINAVTKSGTAEWHGGINVQYETDSLNGDERPILVRSLQNDAPEYIQPNTDSEDRIDPGFFVGGPLYRDRLFMFAAYQPGVREIERTVTFTDGTTNTFPQDFRVDYGAFNLTGNAGSSFLYRVAANFSPYETERSLPTLTGRTSITDPDDYLRGRKGERNTFSGSMDYIPTPDWVFSVRAGLYHTDIEDTEVNFPGIIHNFSTTSTAAGVAALPAEFQRIPGFFSDVLIGDATARDEYEREYIGADGTWYAEANGQHSLKFGYQTENISNDVQSGYNADRILYYAGRSYTTSTGQSVSGQYGYFRLLNISTLGAVESRNEAIFLQDTWEVGNFSINAGLRAEHERIPNFGERGPSSPIEFDYDDKLAPRLGFVWDIGGEAKWKAYASYGKYYDVMKYELPRGSFGGDKWVDYFYTWDNPNFLLNDAASCRTGSNTIAEQPGCPAGQLIEVLDRRFNSAEDLDATVDPNLKPMEQDEYQIGVDHQLRPDITVGARYVRKELVRTIEDVGILVPGVGEVFFIANPGEGISLTLNDPNVPAFPKATREYDGLELTFNKRLTDKWALWANYTYSRLYGNYSGLASSDEDGRLSPNVNRFFDHLENTFDRNGNAVEGRLGTDRPHVLKTQFMYRLPWDITLGANQYIGSGIPTSEEALVAGGVPFYPYGRNNLGRTPTLTRTDLSLFKDFTLGKLNMQLGLNVINLFDEDTVTRRINERTVSSLPLTTQQFFGGGWDYEQLLAANPNLTNSLFNQPDQFQGPRVVRLSVRLAY